MPELTRLEVCQRKMRMVKAGMPEAQFDGISPSSSESEPQCCSRALSGDMLPSDDPTALAYP